MQTLILRGAREHNLQDLDLELKLGEWVAFTGPSGSGKTTLVFDTIVAEGQRRFLSALSARARHYFGKLGRPDLTELRGLPPAIAVGQNALTANARSTVGTQSGALDLLRLLFARTAIDPGQTPLTRGHFSFNNPLGACQACTGLGVQDRVDPQLLIENANKSIRDGALVPTLKNGYTVYSQVTLEVMDDICKAHGFRVSTVWSELSAAQRQVVMFGTKKLKVPFGKHSIESRMRWEGITARPREQGYYRGLVPVIEETLKRNRNPNILRFVRSVDCSACAGSRLGRAGREANLGTHTLPELLQIPIGQLDPVLRTLPASAVWDTLRPSLEQRLGRMHQLGLGHLTLARESTTLSGGEAQRLRLAAQLTAGLGGMVVALDEPTLGLHPEGHAGMRAVLDELRSLGNTVLVVEHDPDMVRHADRVLRLGPGAGPEGGRLLDTDTDTEHPLGPPPHARVGKPRGTTSLLLRGASLHNLTNADLRIHLSALNVVLAPSGAGKSSLVFGTLLPALTGARGGPFTALEGTLQARVAIQALDARAIGRTSRSTPATWSGLFDGIRRHFAALPEARARGYGPGRFSYNNKEGRCATCEGLGIQRIGLHLLEDVQLPCPCCSGGRYNAQTLQVHDRGRTIADVLALTVREACDFFADAPTQLALCRAMQRLGLAYLQLGQASNTLSRGEAQRVKLATVLASTGTPTLLLLDEPDRGLHPADIKRLLAAFDALLDAGHTIVAISHSRQLWAAADHCTEVRDGATTHDPHLDLSPLSTARASRPAATPAKEIVLLGVRTHTLRNLDVHIPHRKLTVIAGVSGSGKTSLAFDTLAAEAWHRFSESLPFAVRRFVRRLPRPALDSASGLGPTLALRQGQARAGRRSTVATQSELGPLLRLLWSRAGLRDGVPCELTAAAFNSDSTLGACPSCEGLGIRHSCDPDLLLTHPHLSLAQGAMQGTRAGKFFGEPDGQYLATLRCATAGVDLDRPWAELSEQTQKVALYGTGATTYQVNWEFSRGERSGAHQFEGTWDGLCALVEREARRRANSKQAASWAAALAEVPCADCHAERLHPDVIDIKVGGLRLGQLMQLRLEEVAQALAADPDPQRRSKGVLAALSPDLHARLHDLCGLGLGHLELGRPSQSLSEGELQRVRLAGVLRSGLTGVTVVLDEPSAGLHDRDVGVLLTHLKRLRDEGNTIIVVAHRPKVLAAADHIIEMGIGSGDEGGQIIAQGGRETILAQTTSTPPRPRLRSALTDARLKLVGAHAHNLQSIDLELPATGFVAVTGVSGSGKSSLLFNVLEASATARSAVACTQAEGLERFTSIRSSREHGAPTTPLNALGLVAPMQQLYACLEHDLPKQAFSFLSPKGRCATCKGSGREHVAMDFLADLALPCPVCEGRRYRAEVLAIKWKGLSPADFLTVPVTRLLELLPSGKLAQGLATLIEVGLGHLGLGRRSSELSGGERARLGLATSIAPGRTSGPTLYVLDEPATGLHEADLEQLVAVFQRQADQGDLVVIAEHRRSLIGAADWVVELGPGSGPNGGRLLRSGPQR